MDICDLKPGNTFDEVTGTATEKTDPITLEYRNSTVSRVKLTDKTGACTLTLWDDDIPRVEDGATVTVKNGWCKEYRGEIQISKGMDGAIITQP